MFIGVFVALHNRFISSYEIKNNDYEHVEFASNL